MYLDTQSCGSGGTRKRITECKTTAMDAAAPETHYLAELLAQAKPQKLKHK